jgi:filamentous hemagglutinin
LLSKIENPSPCIGGLDCSAYYISKQRELANQARNADNSGEGQSESQQQTQSNTANPNPNDPNKKPVFGERGTQTTSTTVGKGQGWRIDVENPNPGQRPGQVHYQSGDKKYLYDPNTKSFIGASKTENKQLLNDAQVQRAIKKGLKVLGEN